MKFEDIKIGQFFTTTSRPGVFHKNRKTHANYTETAGVAQFTAQDFEDCTIVEAPNNGRYSQARTSQT